MVEPISVISTVAGVTAAGIKLSCALYNICDNVASSQEQIEELASDLTDFTAVVKELGKLLEQHRQVYSEALTNSLLDILEKCKRQFQQVKRMIGKTESETTSVIRFKSKVAWVFREAKVRALMVRLDSTKLTLLLMLQTLRIAAENHQNDQQDRQFLANILRSQQRSVKTLVDIEQSSKGWGQTTQPEGTGVGNSARPPPRTPGIVETLQMAVPYVTEQTPSPVPSAGSYNPPQAASPLESASTVAPPQQFTAVNLGSLYPIWKDRVLDNVDDLFRRWTKVPEQVYEMDAGPVPPISDRDRLVPVVGMARDPLEVGIGLINQEIEELSRRKERLLKDNEQFSQRRQKIEERLLKRDSGWLMIEDSALRRLEQEITLLASKEQSNDGEITECNAKIQAAKVKQLELENRASSPKNSSQSQALNFSPRRSSDNGSIYSVVYGRDQTAPWLDDPPSASDDSDTELPSSLEPVASSPLGSSASGAPGRGGAPHPRAKPEDETGNQNLSIKRIACCRKAYKQPERFSGGLNIFSHVLRTMGYPPLWFHASEDAYNFKLGGELQSFYTVELASEDLGLYDSSTIKWTVIGKPWAHPKALTTLAWPFVEDSIGYMWIEKELSWYEVSKISELSWDLLDRALAVSSREIMRKRSTEEKEKSRRRLPFSPRLTADQKGGANPVDHHKAFFHEDDPDLRKRVKPVLGRFRSVS